MSKIISLVIFCFTATFTMLALQGCDKEASASTKANQTQILHLSSFLSLHNEYCEKKYDSSESLKAILQDSETLTPAKNFEGVYEVLVNNISFAVSPEGAGCTTDVMLLSNGNELFSFEDINTALLHRGYIDTGNIVSSKNKGFDNTELMVIEKKYISPNGEVTTLGFPLEKKDKYYMTLFVEKFERNKRKFEEEMLKSLKMAVL